MKKYYRYEIDTIVGSVASVILLIIFASTIFLFNFTFEFKDIAIFYIILMCYLALHELLHGIAYYLTGVNRKKITFGVALEKGVLYCLTKDDTTKKSILTSLLTPFTIIGIITYIISIIFNMPVLWLLSLFNISGCSSDLLMFIFIKRIKDKDLKYRELDDGLSFVITTNQDLSLKKYLGVKLISVSDSLTEDLKSHDNKKITVTKPSIIILLIMLVFIIGGILC